MPDSWTHKHELQQNRDGLAREFIVAHRYIRLGYKPISIADKEVRSVFDVKGRCADLVFQNRQGTCIIADSKGASIGNAVEQLRNTAACVKERFRSIEPQVIICKPGNPEVQEAVGAGCTAKRDRTGAYVLLDANGSILEVEGSPIQVIFST